MASIPIPTIEVHISNIFAREPFRQQSVVSEVYSLNLFFISLVSWVLIELLVGAKDGVGEGGSEGGGPAAGGVVGYSNHDVVAFT